MHIYCILALNHHYHDDVIKWKHFPHYWPSVRAIHWSLVDSPRKGQWRGALLFSLISAWKNGWANNLDAGDLRCHYTHYDVPVMVYNFSLSRSWTLTSTLTSMLTPHWWMGSCTAMSMMTSRASSARPSSPNFCVPMLKTSLWEIQTSTEMPSRRAPEEGKDVFYFTFLHLHFHWSFCFDCLSLKIVCILQF